EVDDRFEPCRRLHGKMGWLVAAQNAVDIRRRLAKQVDEIISEGHEPTGRDVSALIIDRRDALPGRERDDEVTMDNVRDIRQHDQAPVRHAGERLMARSTSAAASSTGLSTTSTASDGATASAARRKQA